MSYVETFGCTAGSHGQRNPVNDRQQYNRSVLAPVGIGNNRAENRQKVSRRDKQVIPRRRISAGHCRQCAIRRHQVLGHEYDENRTHAIKTESLSDIVSDDVWYALLAEGTGLVR